METTKKKKGLPAWMALAIIALAAGLMLGMTNALTEGPIAEQERLAQEAARKAVLPIAESYTAVDVAADATVQNCYEGTDASGQVVGYTAQTTVRGYGGEIEIVVGMDMSGTVLGINVGGAGFAETAGLGAKAKDASFMAQFAGLTAPIVTGEDVDVITGATITTDAVVDGVNICSDYILGIIG